jgi:hypothetical protein
MTIPGRSMLAVLIHVVGEALTIDAVVFVLREPWEVGRVWEILSGRKPEHWGH